MFHFLFVEFHIEDVTAKSQQLSKYLWSRHVPVEENVFQENVEKFERQILNDGLNSPNVP